MAAAELAAIVVLLGALCATGYVLGLVLSPRGAGFRDRVGDRIGRRHGTAQPVARPIEAIAADLRRLGTRFHALPPHASYIKVEAVRGAYDRVLGECCASLGVTTLLGVLAPGAQLDDERDRVERTLAGHGVDLPRAV